MRSLFTSALRVEKWLPSLLKRISRPVMFSVRMYALKFQSKHRSKIVRIIIRFPGLYAYLRAVRNSNIPLFGKSSVRRSASSKSTIMPLCRRTLPTGKYCLSTFQTPLIPPLGIGKRTIYYYVDHTILYPASTGVQRVTRGLGKAILERSEQVRFVKWDANLKRFILLDRADLAHLSQRNGPIFSPTDLENYPLPYDQAVCINGHVPEEGHWLVIPEVTYITYQGQPMTLDVLMEAKNLGLKTAFVFYDAIPLRRDEIKEVAPSHETYMQQLLLADLVVPISNWSARDLVSFFYVHERAAPTSIPLVAAISLPGESQLVPRVTVPVSLDNMRKLILSVGTIAPHKNQLALVHAFERYCDTYPETGWRLALVGNLHPDLTHEINCATTKNSRIKYLHHASDEELITLYRTCSFTVFPSVEEGFGLPILESLWYAKPCVCANFGSMVEVAAGGGCLAIDTRDPDELFGAITRLTMDPALLGELSQQAVKRTISGWGDYAKQFIGQLDHASDPIHRLGVIYYWVDHTCTYPANSGIQRVVRGLARALLEIGIKLIPVKWDESNHRFYSPTPEELQHLAKWNGPQPSEWSSWVDPSQATVIDWILIPELTTYLPHTNSADIKCYAAANRLRCAWIFYDAIPWKMRDIYPPQAILAHQGYMEGLNEFERVFAISEHSRSDLSNFLASSRMPTPNLEERVLACVLPGEFLEAARVTEIKAGSTEVTKILCVCTIEPRKNHLRLLEAYAQLIGQTQKPIELWLVGGSPFPDLAEQVNHYINAVPGIHWEQSADDSRLRELYAECDFTVYPSFEEGFGLPILESLWNARPCICRNSGAMAEVAEGGGCLIVETADATELAGAMLRLIEDDELRRRLAREATARPFKSWSGYAREVATRMATERSIPLPQQLPELIEKDDFYKQFVNIQPRPVLSICITTYNRAEWLALSLKNLARLIPDPRAEIEIVVCDNTSTDHTQDVVQPYFRRTDFRYYRNPENVGMLGNLRVTANHASGQYIWILGDDDLVKLGGIEHVLQVIQTNPGIALVYLNYAFTRQEDAKAVTDLDQFLGESVPIVTPGPDKIAEVREISTESENFFTAIYCLVFRRDHALKAYSQNTDGRPFSTLLTCIPTTYYVLNFMMKEPACWIGEPQLVVNMNVSWMKYAPLWILERLPEVYDLAEKMGANPSAVDRWRINNLPGVVHFFREIFENDKESNAEYFSAQQLVNRMKHLDKFRGKVEMLRSIYDLAHNRKLPGAEVSTAEIFAAFEN